jgi:hypothetical protein
MTVPVTPEIAEAAIDEFITTIAERLDRANAVRRLRLPAWRLGTASGPSPS